MLNPKIFEDVWKFKPKVTVRRSELGGGEISRTRPDVLRGPSCILVQMDAGSLSRG
jgi:hypothetical protein